MECIVLAGGLGTRLRSVLGEEIPKCMAPVAGKPFLEYLVRYLETQGCTRLILSLGYKHEAVSNWVNSRGFLFPVDWVIEETPLGTGGGIRKAILKAAGDNVCVLNGDTMFRPDLQQMLLEHRDLRADATLALKPMENFNRYGIVVLNEAGRIVQFQEKQERESGLINGGVYIIRRDSLLSTPLPEKFSFEKDYLEKKLGEQLFNGFISDSYFIDIGVPEDYERAQTEIPALAP